MYVYIYYKLKYMRDWCNILIYSESVSEQTPFVSYREFYISICISTLPTQQTFFNYFFFQTSPQRNIPSDLYITSFDVDMPCTWSPSS